MHANDNFESNTHALLRQPVLLLNTMITQIYDTEFRQKLSSEESFPL